MTFFLPFLTWFAIGGLTLVSWPLVQLFDIHDFPLTLTLIVVASFPHFALSYFLFYGQKGLARRHWVVAYVIPLLLIAVLAVASPSPTLTTIVVQLAFFSFFHHIGKQAYGVSLFHSGDEGRGEKAWRRLIWLVALSWPVYAWCDQQSRPGTFMAFKSFVGSLEFPSWIAWVALAVAVLSTFAALGFWLKRWKVEPFDRTIMAWTPLLALVAWCVPSLGLSPLGLVPVLHGFQYLPFGWIKLRDENWKPVSAAIIFALSFVLGYLLFQSLPVALIRGGDLRADRWVAALYVFLNVHHFVLDRYLWRHDSFYARHQESPTLR